MRTCPNCGHMLSEKDTICFKCGMQLSQISKPSGMGGGPSGPMMPVGMNPRGGNMRGVPSSNNKKSDNSKIIYIVMGVVVVLAILIVVIVFVNKNSKYEETDNTNSNVVLKHDEEDEEAKKKAEAEAAKQQQQNPDPQPDPEPQQPEKPTVNTDCGNPIITEGYHLVANNGYGYAVPDEYTAKDYGVQGFDILNYKKTKEMLINISKGSLANIKETLPAVKQMYIDSGAVVHNIKVTTISDIEMACVELTKNGQNMVIGITDAAEGEIFVIAAFNAETNEIDYDVLAEGANIVKSAKKTTCSGGLSVT